MKRKLGFRRALILSVVLFLFGVSLAGQSPRPRRVAVFGSSVAFGTGDETNKEGYTGLLRELLAPRGWEVLNVSRPGDTTTSAALRWTPQGEGAANTRHLLPSKPGYVVIALALANEGILEARSTEAKEAVFKQFADGIRGFVDRARQNNIVPIVTLVYPRMAYTLTEYAYARRMNLLLNSWDVPSVNLMGAVDDGTGRYVAAFDRDDRHPNAAGHREMFYAFVPSLFEALEKGKPKPTRPTSATGFARIEGPGTPITFDTEDTMHSFAMGVTVRTQASGAIASISGAKLSRNTPLTPDPDGAFGSLISVLNGKFAYSGANGTTLASTVDADGQWHQLLISHYVARGETLFFVDGKLVGSTPERLAPLRFALGGPRGTKDYKDLLVYRSALNADEAAALASGELLQASLEVYAPLAEEFSAGAVNNLAQSMSVVKAPLGQVTHVKN